MIEDALSGLTGLIKPHVSDVAMVIVATLLVVFGDVVNKHIKRALSPYHFVIRTSAFVLICAFGYGALMLFVSPFLAKVLLLIPSLYFGIVVVSVFLLLGYMAENRRYI